MDIEGVVVLKDDGYVICYIENLSNSIKTLIRDELNIICHGKNQVDEDISNFFSYERTLKDFLSRYESKPDNTKKGMIGEFIAHLIINKVLTELETISIFFNKEELSIKKGFDLNYINSSLGDVWYGEVKSGELLSDSTPDSSNKSLIANAKSSILDFLGGSRPNLWESVIIDAGLSFKTKKRKKVQELLKTDIKEIEDSQAKKNSILISVLFHDSNNRISNDSVKEYLSEIVDEDCFKNVIIFSIQKSTYQKIELFLKEECE